MTKRKKIALVCINAALLALLGFCLWQCRDYETTLVSQQTARSWAGESTERFAQVSCFFPVDSAVATDTVNAFRKTIDPKLAEAGVEAKETGGNWTDAYAAVDALTAESDRASAVTTTFAVGGNFFGFHPYRLLSGSYFRDDDLMKDRVVIDHELAWRLFGGTKLDGKTLKINGKPFYIAGVIERENDKFTARALAGQKSDGDDKTGGTPPLLFMSYAAYASLNDSDPLPDDGGSVSPPSTGGTSSGSGGTPPAKGGTATATDIQPLAVPTAAAIASASDNVGTASAPLRCYEIVLADPISRFGVNLVSEGFKALNPVVVENSARYSFSNIWSSFKTPGARSVVTSPVVFPYWENAARVSEDYVAREYVIIALLGVFPLVCLVWLLVLLIRFLTAKIKRLCFNIWDAWDDRYGRKQAREQRKAMRAAVIEAVESGELPPEELPAPETAEEKFEAFFGKTKREAEKAGEKTKTLFSRAPKPREPAAPPTVSAPSAAPEQSARQSARRSEKRSRFPKLPRKKASRRRSAEAHTEESAASLLSEFEQMDVERIVREVLDEEAEKKEQKK